MQRVSTWLALRCKEPEFRDFLRVPDEPTAVRVVRALCDVKSRSEIDSNTEAATRFHNLIRLPYSRFLTEKEKSHV